MLQLESYFKTRKTEEEIHRLEQENLRAELSLQREKQISTYLIGILILSFVIIILFVFLFLSKIRTDRTLEANKRAVDEANATKDKFFSIIAHDLRSPFNSILGMASLIKDKGSDLDGKEMKKMLSTLHDSAQKSYALLNNLLQWANSQSGRMPFSPEKIRLIPVIREVTDLLKSNFSQKNVKLIDAAENLSVYADKNMLQTILRNLLSNAVKYSKPGGNVRIGTEELHHEVLISVSDSGIGIPECEQEHLFHLTDGYQIPGTSGEKGSGLGLVICKEFTERHGGRIWVESEKGKGSTFYFSLPKEK
jgi:signal transduction histidine kinase